MTANLRRSLPVWLENRAQVPLPQASPAWFVRKRSYFDDMLADINTAISEELSLGPAIGRQGVLHRLHIHIKLACFAVLLLIAASTRELAVLLLLHVVIGGAAGVSGISLRQYVVRTWLPALVFAGIAVLPSIFSIITPGDALTTIAVGNWHLAITRQGVAGAVFILLRATISLGLVMLLMTTTRWPVLTAGLRKLGIPAVMVAVMDLTYRYLFLFLLLLAEFVLGRKSRVVSKQSFISHLSWIGSSIAGFFRLTEQYGKDITQALIARGYTGTFTSPPCERPYSSADKATAAALIVISVLYIGRIQF